MNRDIRESLKVATWIIANVKGREGCYSTYNREEAVKGGLSEEVIFIWVLKDDLEQQVKVK